MIDFEVLLNKYIIHVGNCEGSVFLSGDYYRREGDAGFTDEEWEWLQTPEDEIQARKEAAALLPKPVEIVHIGVYFHCTDVILSNNKVICSSHPRWSDVAEIPSMRTD